MKKCNFIYLVFIILFFYSCSIVGNSTNLEESKIVGDWQLIHLTGGIGGVNLTPDSTRFTAWHFSFKSNNTYSFSRADTLVKLGRYSLKRKSEHTIIRYANDSFSDQSLTFNSSDTLILSGYHCYDCFTETYKRIR